MAHSSACQQVMMLSFDSSSARSYEVITAQKMIAGIGMKLMLMAVITGRAPARRKIACDGVIFFDRFPILKQTNI